MCSSLEPNSYLEVVNPRGHAKVRVMHDPIPPMIEPGTPTSKPKFELRVTAVKFDAESFTFSLFNETELLLNASVEFLLDILASAPEEVHPYILKGLADAQIEYHERFSRTLREHPERVHTQSVLVPEGENYRRVFYCSVTHEPRTHAEGPRRHIHRSHKGALYRVVRALAEGEPLPAPDRVMIQPETWKCFLLEEISEGILVSG